MIMRRRQMLIELINQVSALRMEMRQLTSKINQAMGLGLLDHVATEESMAKLTDTVNALADKVTQQSTVIDGATVAIQELKNQITGIAGDLSAAGEDEAAAKLNELAAAIDANTQKLAIAVAKNTDANDEVHAAQM